MIHAADRKIALTLLLAFLFAGAYFFQGGGWNQNAFIDMTRAIVEKGTLEITRYADNTGDVAEVDGRVFALKSPGLAVWTSVFYLPVRFVQLIVDIDPDERFWANFNAHVMNAWGAALPGAFVVLGLFVHFRRKDLSTRAAVFLSASFGLGSLVLPYSGLLMRGNLLAACFLWAWLHLSHDDREAKSNEERRQHLLIAGALLGLAVLTDYMVLPLVVIWLAAFLVRHRRLYDTGCVALGVAIAGVLIGLINWYYFGAPWRTVYTFIPDEFSESDLFLGVFGLPDLRRVYWLSFHPYRGIFYCCPVLLLGFSWLLQMQKPKLPSFTSVLAILAIGYYLTFNLCFNGWSGGVGIGPRYLAPMLPLFFSFAHLGWSRARWIAFPLAGLSAYAMLGVTSVLVMIPARNFGPPPEKFNPVLEALSRFHDGRLSLNSQGVQDFRGRFPAEPADAFDSYNLGEVLGLQGLSSLIPLLVGLLLFAIVLWRLSSNKLAQRV